MTKVIQYTNYTVCFLHFFLNSVYDSRVNTRYTDITRLCYSHE